MNGHRYAAGDRVMVYTPEGALLRAIYCWADADGPVVCDLDCWRRSWSDATALREGTWRPLAVVGPATPDMMSEAAVLTDGWRL